MLGTIVRIGEIYFFEISN